MKNINFRFSAEGILKISAPCEISYKAMLSAIKKNENAVYRLYTAVKTKKHFSLKDDDFQSGSEIFLWGEKVEICFSKEAAFSHLDKNILYIKEDNLSDVEKKKKALNDFLHQTVKSFLLDFSKEIYSLYFKERVGEPSYSFKSLKSRWGSCCKAKNLITYNQNLIFLPREFAEYIMVHEFCHLIVFDHSKAFYDEVKKIMPDYKRISDIQKEYTF